MNILISTLKEELTTVKRLEKKYLKEFDKLPIGSFVARSIRNRKYGYLTFREGNKVKQKYLGALDDESVAHYKSVTERKKSLRAKLKSVREQKKILERALRARTAKTGR